LYGGAETGSTGWAAAGRAGAFSGAPQLSQNASPGIAAAPHCGQITEPDAAVTAGTAAVGAIGAAGAGAGCVRADTGISAAPHWSQKRALAGLSTPH
jgi:hypothetical protein